MQMRILIVEDDTNIQDVCRRYLEQEGYEVYTATDGLEGWELYRRTTPSLLILDLMMPKKDGWSLCEEIRQESDIPIIMLTARGEERDRLMGLTIGADDYLTKPFSPRELVLRVRAILRRRNWMKPHTDNRENQKLKFEGLLIDPQARRVFVNGNRIDLTLKEFELLYLMAKRPGQVFSRMQLLDLVWGSQYESDANTVTVQISRLREKIEVNPSEPYWIHTVWGIGYRFEPGGGGVSL
ncbi:response regulator transcription factor [Paenactinomyces guangxiensis]|uniref:Response regulator transcription factor n=1 Tax=Paenactinomyces guangxiensis TaxID=1490290 RepID=A0A7W1WRA7_9BACL|nr:response regulator transcription factor [Paenactinomyces guangxiensis]MBA4494634.1 response regulator transcription factor [Paenactinomyces guangxiensis]MBH8591603.1 response regulator transcription factor [Paenactinomyces guangxiensis]